jgi:hypothetical protein
MSDKPDKPDRPPRWVYWLCKKPITGQVYFQGGQFTHPSHRRCLVTIGKPKGVQGHGRLF